jgi:DnaJ like chaperone protein
MSSITAFADQDLTAPAAEGNGAVVQSDIESASFTHALVALAAMLSAVDGTPNNAEYLAFQSLFVADGAADETKLRSMFVKLVRERASSLQYARQIAAMTKTQSTLRREIFVRLVRIGTADGMLNAAEIEWLRAVGKAMGMMAEDTRSMIEQCFTYSARSPYVLLGVSPQVDDEQLRAAYMAKVHALHPDRYQAAGASEETISMLSNQLASVNAAYHDALAEREKKRSGFISSARIWGAKTARSAKANMA